MCGESGSYPRRFYNESAGYGQTRHAASCGKCRQIECVPYRCFVHIAHKKMNPFDCRGAKLAIAHFHAD